MHPFLVAQCFQGQGLTFIINPSSSSSPENVVNVISTDGVPVCYITAGGSDSDLTTQSTGINRHGTTSWLESLGS